MATTTATITLASSDITGDTLSLSTTATLTKADSNEGLDQTQGIGRKHQTLSMFFTTAVITLLVKLTKFI